MENVDLGACVRWAYRVREFQVAGPELLNGGAYDVLGRTEHPVTVAQLRVMLQNLLAKRCGLVVHRESRLLPVYELTVGRTGSQLPAPKAENPSRAVESLPRVEAGSFVFRDVTMDDFAALISEIKDVDLPMVNRTGIGGVYDITLKGAAAAILQPGGPAILNIVEEQLGLKVTAAKSPVEMLVVDRVTKPTRN